VIGYFVGGLADITDYALSLYVAHLLQEGQ